MNIKLNKAFETKIRAAFKRKDSTPSYDFKGTFKVLKEDFMTEGTMLVLANPTGHYKKMLVLKEHYDVVD